MCSLQQHNNAAPGENEKMKEKAKKAAVLLISVQKCDLIYTERFGIVKTAGARTKQLQIGKMTFCDNVMLLTAGGDFYE